MIKTEELFTFELDMGSSGNRLVGQGLEDAIYNCLDFCLLNKKQAHFYLAGKDAAHHPELWQVLEILREENATFSILSEPEQSAFARCGAMKMSDSANKVMIRSDGEAYSGGHSIGNILTDRLADLWEVMSMQEEKLS